MSSDADATASAAALAGSLRAVGQLDRAEQVLREASAHAPEDPVLLVEWATLLQHRGDLAGAESAARAAVRAAPESLAGYVRLALVLVAAQRGREARAVTAQLVAQAPDVPAVWTTHALASVDDRRPGSLATVRDAYRRAIDLAPDDPDHVVVAAVCEHAYRRHAVARDLVARGLSIAPQSPALLGLRAEYAPVREQPALLLDLLTTNPADQEARELLDAAVTWERRLAATAAVLPVVVAVVALGAVVAAPAAAGPLTTLLAAVSGGLALLVRRRYRARRDRLPTSYLDTLPATGRRPARWAAWTAAVATAAGAVLAWTPLTVVAPVAVLAVLGVAVVAGLVVVATPLPGDDRVLLAARRRSGRVAFGTAWRYGGLRQELALGTGLAVAALTAAVAGAVLATAPIGAVTLVAWPAALVTAASFVEAVRAGRHAPQRWLRAVGVRYRLVALLGLTALLLVLGGLGLRDASARAVPVDDGRSVPAPAPSWAPPTSVPTPTLDLPSFPPFDVPSIGT
ncbi:tetratricopeptide repeat protein [Curtobacterium sp. UCD-KPL2560]|uniref:tetratricopeptide repeat protein n=1 Tax=Curtobacterium sp. UCD-KPL2560 TaxID=1885315 RepID=UPI0008249F3A